MLFSLVSCDDDNTDDNKDGTDNGFNYTVTITDADGNPVPGVKFMITDDSTLFETKTTDTNGKASHSLEIENKNLGVDILNVPEGYEKPATAASGYHATFGDKTEVTIKLEKKASETKEYTVKVVDGSGNAVSGVALQVCVEGSCYPFDTHTDANGQTTKKLNASSVEGKDLKIKITELPSGYTMPDTVDGEYHLIVSSSTTEVIVLTI